MDTGFEQVHVDLGLTARKVFIHKLDDDVSRRGHDFPSIQVLRSFSRAVYLPVAYTRKPLAGGGRPRKRGPPPTICLAKSRETELPGCQKSDELMISPPLRVPRARQTPRAMALLMNRTDPSPRRRLTPPGCSLDGGIWTETLTMDVGPPIIIPLILVQVVLLGP